MDPTMQSPRRLTIPVSPPYNRLPPLSDGVQVTIPSGPHHYSTKSWVGSISQGNTPQQAFDSLSRHATPFQGGVQSVDGGVIDIPVLGRVRQIVDPERLTIVNTTEPGHHLYPGNVFRSIVREGDDLFVVTQGYGTGVLPTLNEIAAPHGWSLANFGIRRELNPYPSLGYPMDEMNAISGAGGPPRGTPPDSVSNGVSGNSSVGKSLAVGPDSWNPTRSAPLSQTDGVMGSSNNRPVRYLSGTQGNNPSASAFDTGTPATPPVSDSQSPRGLPALIEDHIRLKNERVAAKPPVSVFDAGAQAVTFIPHDHEGKFADRFGDRPPVRRLSSLLDRR